GWSGRWKPQSLASAARLTMAARMAITADQLVPMPTWRYSQDPTPMPAPSVAPPTPAPARNQATDPQYRRCLARSDIGVIVDSIESPHGDQVPRRALTAVRANSAAVMCAVRVLQERVDGLPAHACSLALRAAS